MKKIMAIVVATIALCFAQDAPEKLAVYVFGVNNAGINKSLSSKLLLALAQSGKYVEIPDPESFQDELAKVGKGDMAQISLFAKRYYADYVCVVDMMDKFGAYSISARLIKINGFQIIKTGTIDRALRLQDDIVAVSNELTRQLIPPNNFPPVVAPEAYKPVAETFDYRLIEAESSSLETKNEVKDEVKDETKNDKKIISFGIRAGINNSWIHAEYSDKVGDYTKKIGVQLGMVLDIAASKMFHFQPGIIYIKKGTNEYQNYYYGQQTYSINAHYIEIPALLSLKLDIFRLNIGPYLDAFLGATDETVYGKDFGFTAGLGVDIGKFYIGVLYNHGLSNMSSEAYSNFYSRSIGLDVGMNL